jgi:four helix bundle protein
MDIFETSKLFPGEEIYSLTDQVRRSSRSVCANLGEAYRKKMYPAHFVSKVSDSDTENTEQMFGSIFYWLANTLHTKNMHK